MNRSEVLELLYKKLPNKKANELIDLVLSDSQHIKEAEQFLLDGEEPTERLNLFSVIKGKPLYKNVSKFMDGSSENVFLVMKMLSSIITQILIQCELRETKTPYSVLDRLTKLLLSISENEDTLSADDEEKIKSEIYYLGWDESLEDRQGDIV